MMLSNLLKKKLHNLIFDNQAHFNHRVLAAILGVILKLPPVKQIMASEQVKSKYLVRLIERRKEKATSSKKMIDRESPFRYSLSPVTTVTEEVTPGL